MNPKRRKKIHFQKGSSGNSYLSGRLPTAATQKGSLNNLFFLERKLHLKQQSTNDLFIYFKEANDPLWPNNYFLVTYFFLSV